MSFNYFRAHSQQTVTQPQVNPPAPAAPVVQAAGERQENRQENRNMVMNANAGGGMMQEEDDDDDENVQRDWLDYVYMVVRIFMLMSIFWFYSSAERLILMGATIFIVWMLQSGWFNLHRAQRNRHQGEIKDQNSFPMYKIIILNINEVSSKSG